MGTLGIAVLVMGQIFARAATEPPPSVLKGTIQAGKGACKEGAVEAFVSDGPTLLYQAEVPLGGSFEFKLKTGKYNLIAVSSTGCSAEKTLSMTSGRTETVTLKLESQAVKK